MFEGLTKKLGQKNKIFPRVPYPWHSGKVTSSPSALSLALGEGPLPRVPSHWHSGKYFVFCLFFAPIFCEAFKHYLKLLAQIWLTFEFFCYISLVFYFS
jgi:hypothetical protein